MEKLWNEQMDSLLKYFYEDMKIYNWETIAKEMNSRAGSVCSAADCRNRYSQLAGQIAKNEWTPEEEKELYRLHNQNGNRWAVIAHLLLGRTDNSVKNHFYSKLRKSLRTLNKVAKLHLKKVAKEVGGQVIYKLTEATDESLKENTELSKELTIMCYDLKNRLLEYDMDQRQISSNLDFTSEKKLLADLSNFNKLYKKKTKKLVPDAHKKPRKRLEHFNDDSFDPSDSQYERQPEPPRDPNDSLVSIQPKKTINFVIKEPSKEEQQQYEKESVKPRPNRVEDILRAEGILENGEYGAVNLFRRDNSSRSFSVRSESSNPPDMFGESQQFGDDSMFQGGFREVSDIGNDSQIFNEPNE